MTIIEKNPKKIPSFQEHSSKCNTNTHRKIESNSIHSSSSDIPNQFQTTTNQSNNIEQQQNCCSSIQQQQSPSSSSLPSYSSSCCSSFSTLSSNPNLHRNSNWFWRLSSVTSLTFSSFYFLFLSLLLATTATNASVVQLNADNFDAYTARYEVVFLNFYADWCRFSQLLAPVFEDAGNKIAVEFPDDGKVLFAKVDCEHESSLGTRFHINKYPTLKLMLNGKVHKREYRGQRSSEAMVQHVRDLLKDTVKTVETLPDYNEKIPESKASLVAYARADIAKTLPNEYNIFRKVARDLKDDCHFYWVSGVPAEDYFNSVLADGVHDQLSIRFKPPRSPPKHGDLQFPGTLKSYDELSTWATDKCIPLVREITFENAEELTEEGIPFVILFHHPDDKQSVEAFVNVVNQELLSESGSVNFLLADGIKFAHPLQHLGKANKDLPLVAIDSFRHMYMLPHFDDIKIPGKLKQFIQDLYSGKLHREFHFGPDPSQLEDHSNHQTQPPESTFAKLAPSRNRYTLLKDEL